MGAFADVIGLWETTAHFASDLGVPYQTAAAWKRRDSIPPEHWRSVIAKAEQRGIRGVTLERLSKLAEARKPAKSDEDRAA